MNVKSTWAAPPISPPVLFFLKLLSTRAVTRQVSPPFVQEIWRVPGLTLKCGSEY